VVSSSYDGLLGISISHSKDFYLTSAGIFLFDSIELLITFWLLVVLLVIAGAAFGIKRSWFQEGFRRVIVVRAVWIFLIVLFALKIAVLDGPVYKLNNLLFRALDSHYAYGTDNFADRRANELQMVIACTHSPHPTDPPCDQLSWDKPFLSRAWALITGDLRSLTAEGLLVLNLVFTILIVALSILALRITKEPKTGTAELAVGAVLILSLVGCAATYAKLLKPVTFAPVQIDFRPKEGGSSERKDPADADKKKDSTPPPAKPGDLLTVHGYLLSESDTEYTVYRPEGPEVFYIPREEIHDMVVQEPVDVLKELAKSQAKKRGK